MSILSNSTLSVVRGPWLDSEGDFDFDLSFLSYLFFISDSSPYWNLQTWIGLHAGADLEMNITGVHRWTAGYRMG